MTLVPRSRYWSPLGKLFSRQTHMGNCPQPEMKIFLPTPVRAGEPRPYLPLPIFKTVKLINRARVWICRQ